MDISLENFVTWLIMAEPDDRFLYRHHICAKVKELGKDKVLDELQKQSQSFKNLGEAVITAQIVKGITCEE